MTPEQLAADVVLRMIEAGLAKHSAESWRTEPATMHAGKASRHAQTAVLLLDHPEYTQDAETAEEHLERAICRAVMALWRVKKAPPV